MKIDVKADMAAITKEFPQLKRKVKRAAVSSINKTLIKTRNKSAPWISEKTGGTIKPAQVKKEFKITRAKAKKIRGVLSIQGGPIPLIRYQARATKRGVSYNIGQGRKILKGAFIATMPTGHKGVYVRAGGKRGAARIVKKGQYAGKLYKPELTIKERKGPGVPIKVNELRGRIYEFGLREWRRTYAQELRHYLGTYWSK